MKKGLIVGAVFVVVSYAILFLGNNMLGGAETAAGGDATLTGTAEGFGGEVSVTVTLKGGKIADVVATGSNETQGIGSNAIEQLPAKIVEANSTEVDGISGATFTSNAIKEAVNNALASNSGAGGGETLTGTAEGFGGEVSVTVTMDGDKIVNVEATGANETDGIGSEAIAQLPAKIVEANSTEVDGVSGATMTSNAIKEAVKNALAGNATTEEPADESSEEAATETPEGALTGTAEGFGGDVTVTVVMEGDKIVSVEVEGPNETQGIGTNAIDQLPAKIVEANSAEVDVVAGATFTSNAIIEAVNKAIAK